MYSRAGLIALVFALIISLVSAVPIPVTESGLSSALLSPLLNGKVHNRLDTHRISESDRITIPSDATTSVLTRRYISTDIDDEQLVRRNIFSKIKHAFQSFGHKVKEGFQKAGSAIKKGFQKAGSAIKKGFQKVGEGIKTVAKKVGSGIKTAAKKVWGFVKTTGAKVAKFGLKVVESVGEVVGKVASFIPGVGKPIQEAIHGVSKLAGVASDHIHAKLSPKLEKGMKIMNKADQIMDYIPRRRDLLGEEESFQRRGYGGGDAPYYVQFNDIGMEN